MADKHENNHEMEEEEPLAEDEFVVEKILDKRMKGGVLEYFLKWQGFPDSDNTWEPADNLTCLELIEAFEAALKKKKETKPPNKKVEVSKKKVPTASVAPTKKGPDPEKIVGATDASGQLMFLMKWKGSEEADLIPAKDANIKYPQIVIQFYEKRLTWKTPKDDQKE